MGRSTLPDKSSQITVRLTSEILEKLSLVAARVGVKPAQIASLAIGDYVTKMDASYSAANHMQLAMAKEMATLAFEHIRPLLTDDQIKKAVCDIESLEEVLNDD